MTQMDRCRLDMLIRVRNFGASHGQLFPESSPAQAAFTTIGTETDQLAVLDLEEQAAARAARAGHKQAARQALVSILSRAEATARALANTAPALDVPVVLPLPADDLLLLTVARQFVAGIAPFADAFAANGIPIAQVEGRIGGFGQALQEREAARDEKVRVRAEIDASFGRAMAAIGLLDVNIANGLVTDPRAIAAWKYHRRIAYPRRTASGSEPKPIPAIGTDAPAPMDTASPATAA